MDLKSSPIFSKVDQKSYLSSFYLKMMFSKYCESHSTFGLLFKDNLAPRTFKKTPNLVTLLIPHSHKRRRIKLTIWSAMTLKDILRSRQAALTPPSRPGERDDCFCFCFFFIRLVARHSIETFMLHRR